MARVEITLPMPDLTDLLAFTDEKDVVFVRNGAFEAAALVAAAAAAALVVALPSSDSRATRPRKVNFAIAEHSTGKRYSAFP